VTIDSTTARPRCRLQDCVVSVLLGVPDTLLDDERGARGARRSGLRTAAALVPIRRPVIRVVPDDTHAPGRKT
jgi:hypothetical protein